MSQGNLLIKHRKKLIIQIIIPIIVSLGLLFLGYILAISYVKDLLIDSKKNQSKEMVNSVYNLIERYHTKSVKGEISEEMAKENIIFSAKNLRYGNDSKEYFWILDNKVNIISHPYFTDSLSLVKNDPNNWQIIKNLTNEALAINEGFVSYNWQVKDDSSRIDSKISYVKVFKPWNWIIGTGFYSSEVSTNIKGLIKYVTYVSLLIILAITLLFLLIIRRAFFNVNQIIANENELIKNEKRFKGMAQNIDNGLIIKENNKIVFYNKKICEIFGIAENEFINDDEFAFIVPEEKERINLVVNDCQSTNNQVKELSYWIISKDNKKKFITNYYSYEKRDSSEFTYILTSDNTEKKLTESRFYSLSETIEQSPDSIAITDLNGNIIYVNKAFTKITGYSPEEAIGENPRVLKSDKMPPSIYSDLWKTISSGQVWEGEMLNKKKNGELFWEQTIIFPIKNKEGEIINYAAIKTNLTKQKYLENELKLTTEKSKISEKLKTAFLQNISHEVRTPLNAINGFSQILKEEFRHSDTAYKHLTKIINNSKILLNLFENIIEYSTVESGDIKFYKEEIHVYNFLNKIVSKFNSTIVIEDKKSIEIQVDKNKELEKVVVTADKKHLIQVLNNILSNAIKFTKEGHVNIGIKIDYESIVFYIKDTGVGIPKDEYESIFDTFTHGNNMYISLHKGTGLGLKIANRLVQLMGGKLWFESEENKGSTFYFSLPSTDVKNYVIGDNIVDEFPYSKALNNKHIIVGETNDEHFFYLQSMLNMDGVKISWTKTGEELLNLLHDDPKFDLILMNVKMSVIDGFNISRTIKNSYPHIPIIGMSRSDFTITYDEQQSFSAIIPKPAPKNLLLKTISDILTPQVT